jgi:hypothetical protein
MGDVDGTIVATPNEIHCEPVAVNTLLAAHGIVWQMQKGADSTVCCLLR